MLIADTNQPAPENAHYWVVTLPEPPQASELLKSYIQQATSFMQSVVDLLGAPQYAVTPPTPKATLSPPPLNAGASMDQTGFMATSYAAVRQPMDNVTVALGEVDAAVRSIVARTATVTQQHLEIIQAKVGLLADELRAAGQAAAPIPVSYTNNSVTKLPYSLEVKLAADIIFITQDVESELAFAMFDIGKSASEVDTWMNQHYPPPPPPQLDPPPKPDPELVNPGPRPTPGGIQA